MQVTKLCDLAVAAEDEAHPDTICSVSWSQRGSYLSVGTNSGNVQIWDVTKVKMCGPNYSTPCMSCQPVH